MKFSKNLVAILTICFLICSTVFPGSGSAITIKEEEDLSREFLKIVRNRFKLVKDPLLVEYLKKVSERIVAVLPPQPFNYHFYIIEENVYNAFATPAGHIFINSGLIEAMEHEEELAGIISHEISHVVCRHISEKIERSKKINIATLAGIAAGLFLGAAGAGSAANALTVGSMAAGQSLALSYSRDDERQADEIGLKYLVKAGYNPKGLLTVLKKIRSKNWFGSDQIPTYMSTHPATEDRLAYIDTWIQNQKTLPAPVAPYEFKRAHARILALYGDEEAALRNFSQAVQKNPTDPLAHYGYGLILTRTGKFKTAATHFRSALERKALDPYILKELGKTYFLDGRYPEALTILESALGIAPLDSEGLFFIGRAQSALGRLEDASSTFQTILAENPVDTRALYFLAETYGKQGMPAESHYYLGMYYKEKRQFKNAAFHLKRALNGIKDPNKRERIREILEKIGKKSPQDRPRNRQIQPSGLTGREAK